MQLNYYFFGCVQRIHNFSKLESVFSLKDRVTFLLFQTSVLSFQFLQLGKVGRLDPWGYLMPSLYLVTVWLKNMQQHLKRALEPKKSAFGKTWFLHINWK